MGLLAKIKFLFKAAKPAGAFVDQIKGARLKYKTIPFWIAFLGNGIAFVGAIQGFIPATTGVLIIAGLTTAYNFLRGFDKMNQEGIKPAARSTEFWIGLLGLISAAIVDVQTAGVNNEVLTSALTIIGAAMAAAQNLGATQPKDLN